MKYATQKRYVMQDGADFYCFEDAAMDHAKETVAFPGKVRDFDTEAATNARAWFINVWCRDNAIDPEFPAIGEAPETTPYAYSAPLDVQEERAADIMRGLHLADFRTTRRFSADIRGIGGFDGPAPIPGYVYAGDSVIEIQPNGNVGLIIANRAWHGIPSSLERFESHLWALHYASENELVFDSGDGTLDEFVSAYCEANSIKVDGDVFGLAFSGETKFTASEAARIIEDAAERYHLSDTRNFHAWLDNVRERAAMEYPQMIEAGFSVEHTGGGCTAWGRDIDDSGWHILVTTDDASHKLIQGEAMFVGVHGPNGESTQTLGIVTGFKAAIWMADAHEIAWRFADKLKDVLTARQWETMRQRNALSPFNRIEGPCASHDFCDANMPMAEAFREVTGKDIDPASSDDSTLWNRAWEIAKPEYLTARESN